MRQATLVWSLWQALLSSFARAFTRPGSRRFVDWVTALALNVEERTITQSVVAVERTADWKARERLVEYGRGTPSPSPQPGPPGRDGPGAGRAWLPRQRRR
jgi:hypothetical protein